MGAMGGLLEPEVTGEENQQTKPKSMAKRVYSSPFSSSKDYFRL